MHYYNENNEFAADTLEELIRRRIIPNGFVDRRSIWDVKPHDLDGFIGCHFFAGIGLWAYAARAAGWPDDRPIWTGSCPCQPFSNAGAGRGFADERHAWPAWYWLICQRSPSVVFGEQVGGKLADSWLTVVSDDMEALDYRIAAVPFPAAGVGAPHRRDRIYWVADSSIGRLPRLAGTSDSAQNQGRDGARTVGNDLAARGAIRGVADDIRVRFEGWVPERSGHDSANVDVPAGSNGAASVVVDSDSRGSSAGNETASRVGPWPPVESTSWLYCRDGKRRPTESGIFPLAHGLPVSIQRVDAGLRGIYDAAGVDGFMLRTAKRYRREAIRCYGNAIVAEQATEFIRAYVEAGR